MLTYYNEAIKPLNDNLGKLLNTDISRAARALAEAERVYNDALVEYQKACYIEEGITAMTDPVFCPSYYDDKNKLRNCICGRCR